MPPADDRRAIGVIEILRRYPLLPEQRSGIVLNPLVALFDDHVAFGQDVFAVKLDVLHPVRFHFHHQAKAVCRDPLEIGCVIKAGKGVIGAAIRLYDFAEFAGGQFFGPFEQQMFQEMRNPRNAGLFIRRSGAIPDHVDHGGRTVVFDHHDIHPILKLECRDLIFDCLRKQRRSSKNESPGQGHQATHRQYSFILK